MVRGGLGEAFVLVWCRGLNKQLPTGGARGSPRPARKAQQSHDACGLFLNLFSIMSLAQTLATSAIGAMVQLAKGCASIGAKKTTKGHYAVCTDYVPDGDGRDGVTTLYISGDKSAIVDIQTQAIKRTGSVIVERRKAAVAMRRSEKYELGNADLIKVHKEAKKEILRVGMPPLKEADIGLQESSDKDISWSFGKTFTVKGFTPPPSSKSALDVYDGCDLS